MEYGLAQSPQKENLKCKPKSVYGRAKFLSTKYPNYYKVYNELPVKIQKIDFFSSDVTISEISTFTLYKIVYNNSKFGKIYLAATRTKDNTF